MELLGSLLPSHGGSAWSRTPGRPLGGNRRPSEVQSNAQLLTVHTPFHRHGLICPRQQPSETRGNVVTSAATTGICRALSSSALSLWILPKTHEEGDTSLQMRNLGLLAQVPDPQGHREQVSWVDFGGLADG